MEMKQLRVPLLLLVLLQGLSISVRAQGALLVTGHDADTHHFSDPPPANPRTEGFITACLDFLVFGKKATPAQVAKRSAVKIAYIATFHNASDRFNLVSGYSNPVILRTREDDWKSALVPGAFDVVIVGSLLRWGRPEYSNYMLGSKAQFETFLNRGGKLFVMYQEDQSDYGFLPKFGAAVEALSTTVGNFYVTPAGDSIGITDEMINTDFTHGQFKHVDPGIFKVFERTRETTPDGYSNLPVTIGFNGLIKDTVFIPVDSVSKVQKPRSNLPSGPFQDSLCVEFSTSTDSATLAYTLDGSPPASSPLRLPNPGRLCFRQTTTVSLIGKKPGWKDSDTALFTFTRAQGALLITGHDADHHHFEAPPALNPRTEGFITACLDFLVFGKKATSAQIAERPAVKIAYIGGYYDETSYRFRLVSGYPNPAIRNIPVHDWKSALVPGAFDVVVVASFLSNIRPEYRDSLLGAKDHFRTFLNRGGKLFVMPQQEDEDYAFLPGFGASVAALQKWVGNFYVTPAGDSIGITNEMVNTDLTHNQFKHVDSSLYKVFERTRETTPDGHSNLPITFGYNGFFKDTVSIPVDSVSRVQKPRSTIPSGPFQDSLCAEFSTSTDSATLAYTLDGTPPASSPLRLPNPGRLCFRQTTTVSLIGKKPGWKDSDTALFTFTLKAKPPLLPADILGIRPQNTVAKTASHQGLPDGNPWIISDAPNLAIRMASNGGSCCSLAGTPVDARSPDSLRLVGIVIEASRGFSLDLKVFSHLGEPVDHVGFSVPESEFSKLTPVAGKEARFLRLLWNGRTRDGSRAGNGVYIFKSAVTLLPAPGTGRAPVASSSSRRIGILRSPD